MAFYIHQETSQTLSDIIKISDGTDLKDVAEKIEEIQTPSGIGNYNFLDSGIQLKDGFSFEEGKSYFLKLKIKKPIINIEDDEELNITKDLTNKIVSFKLLPTTSTGEQTENKEQFIEDFTIPFISLKQQSSSTSETTTIVQLVFQPLFNFKRMGFILNRTIADLVAIYQAESDQEREAVTKIQVEFDIDDSENKLFEIQSTKSLENLQDIVKLGVQGTPGLLMCINGEGIRLGPSGIYEIKNGYTINSLNFLLENDQQRFILDYESRS